MKFLFFFFVCLFVFCFVFLFFFWGGGGGCTVDAGPEPTNEEKMRVPPTPWDCRMKSTKSCRFVGGRDATEALPA